LTLSNYVNQNLSSALLYSTKYRSWRAVKARKEGLSYNEAAVHRFSLDALLPHMPIVDDRR